MTLGASRWSRSYRSSGSALDGACYHRGVSERSEAALTPPVRQAAEGVLAWALHLVGARQGILEIPGTAGEPNGLVSLGPGTRSSRNPSVPAAEDRWRDLHWFPLLIGRKRPRAEERRREEAPWDLVAWLRLDPAPSGPSRSRLRSLLPAGALFLETSIRLDRLELDPETSLLNRPGFLAALNREAGRHSRNRCAVLLLEPDRGDASLDTVRFLSDLLRRCLRSTDLLGRTDALALAAILRGADGGRAAAAGGRIQRALREQHRKIPPVHAGLALAPHHGRDGTALLRRAARALARAREGEDHSVVLFDDSMDG